MARQGWHSDYPYHRGKAADYAHFPVEINLGLQFNTCIDPFTKRNGATMFVLDSARRDDLHLPPKAWDPPGRHSATPAEAQQIEAAAGSVILYDARMWHRQHVNLSRRDRAAMLNALTPGWVLPQFDQSDFFRRFLGTIGAEGAAPAGCAITAREMRDAHQLMVHTTGAGQPLGSLADNAKGSRLEAKAVGHASGHSEPAHRGWSKL
jgi:ectoine hydroxylase-related dioxygenase (phytanoyl-CoA dioxygenase family)